MNLDLHTVGDLGIITRSLPQFFIPNIPFSLETLKIIFPYSIALAIVGLLESLLTSSIVDDMTETEGDKNKETKPKPSIPSKTRKHSPDKKKGTRKKKPLFFGAIKL